MTATPHNNYGSWLDLFPDGRDLFYEGNDPEGFAAEMKEKFGFDPSENNPYWNHHYGYSFFCPPHALDPIYGNGKYPLGS